MVVLQFDNILSPGGPRVKDSAVARVGSVIYLFGGYNGEFNMNGLFAFNTETMTWELVHSERGYAPFGRNGHTLTYARGKLWLIGGFTGYGGPLASSDVFTFTLEDRSWESVDIKGQGPGPCLRHTTEFVDVLDELLVLRGGDGKSYKNDLHALDVETKTWRLVETRGRPPRPRANHASAVIGNKMYVFGGFDGRQKLGDLHILNLVLMSWSRASDMGNVPKPRSGMSLSAIDDHLVLYGGTEGEGVINTDIFVLDTKSLRWKRFQGGLLSGAEGENIEDIPEARVLPDYALPGSPAFKGGLQDGGAVELPAAVESFDSSPNLERTGHRAIVTDDSLLIFGGATLTKSGEVKYVSNVISLALDEVRSIES